MLNTSTFPQQGRSIVRTMSCGRVLLLAVAATMSLAIPASATGSPIGPNQHYLGYVNNKHVGAVIYVICPGPANPPGRTGPPAGNQPVGAVRVMSGGGYTGSFAHTIWAEFQHDAVNVVRFTAYNTPKPIPTNLRLPCSGKGTVTFTTCFGTLPCAANAKDDVVPVTFLNIAV
jgi:hypothetical protein